MEMQNIKTQPTVILVSVKNI